MKIVITGALGHIGSKLIRNIPTFFPDSKIILIDNLITQRYASLYNLPESTKYKFIECDITNKNLSKIIQGSKAVIHLAALTNAELSFSNPEEIERNNFISTQKISDYCRGYDVPMIHVSSTSVYGTQKKIVDENCSIQELKPQSPYAETKLKEENYLIDKNLKFTSLRFGTIYGFSVGMRFHTAVNKFCWQALLGEPITIWETAYHQKRPYLDIIDACHAIIHVIKNNLYNREIYNILSGNHTVKDISDIIRKFIPDLKEEFIQSPIMNQLSFEVSSQKFRETGFIFRGSIEKSLQEYFKTMHFNK